MARPKGRVCLYGWNTVHDGFTPLDRTGMATDEAALITRRLSRQLKASILYVGVFLGAS